MPDEPDQPDDDATRADDELVRLVRHAAWLALLIDRELAVLPSSVVLAAFIGGKTPMCTKTKRQGARVRVPVGRALAA